MAKQGRIDFQVDKALKAQFTETAEVFGMSLSTFMIAAAKQMSIRAKRMQQLPALSSRDRDLFITALDRTARPMPDSIRKAKKQHASLVVSDQ